MNSYKDEISKLTASGLQLRGPSVGTGISSFHPIASKLTCYSQPATIIEERPLTIWEGMMREYHKERNEVEEYRASKNTTQNCYLPEGSVVEYMEKNVFSILFPALTEVLLEAVKTDSLKTPTSTFDGLDMISQIIWNHNPRYPERKQANLEIHDMPWAQKILEENPRPYFPKSWIYSPEIAAIKIQAFYRGYLVRKRDNVQELREFWKVLKSSSYRKSKNEENVDIAISTVLSTLYQNEPI